MKMFHRWHLLILVGLFIGAQQRLHADSFSNNFASNLNQTVIDALAMDVGAAMGGGSFHTGKALGFPLGFDVGVHVPVISVQDDNAILTDDGSTLAAVWGQAEVGLPGKINVIGRYGKLLDANLVGGGLRFGILKPTVPGLPSLSLTGLYSALDHDFFTAETLSANLVLSLDIPFINPYIGGGYDSTTVEPTTEGFSEAPVGVSRSLEGKANGYRAEVGVNLTFLPFTYLNLGGGMANGEGMYHVGAGVQF